MAEGYNLTEIAEQLGISRKTVDAYKHRIQDKLGLSHRTEFVRFAIDVRYRSAETGWKKDALVGCAYLDHKEVFLQRGADYVPATTALGKDGEPRADVCRGASGDTAQLASAAR